ncbi:hypothetical protein Pcinc_010282 [Petrolisthes cinctipes]|uniref:Uncharacterized protein n=1 Tax=Petrolisthes cinctipes TaxID=88211 RepID=A0AAE1G5R1_PETCI|nr:hypothetical protein Pcinc_013677 [Petrolisthes cinctipes]KAK3885541.1 hypothetical protein Pcinc_010282 [Petrolisthes cinctipes]
MPQLKQARAQGKVAYFRYTKLIIKESPVRGISRPRNETLTVGPGRTQGRAGVAAEDGGAQAPAAAVATAARVVAGADADR